MPGGESMEGRQGQKELLLGFPQFRNQSRDKIKQILADYRAGKAADFRQLPYSTNDYRSYKPGPGEPVRAAVPSAE